MIKFICVYFIIACIFWLGGGVLLLVTRYSYDDMAELANTNPWGFYYTAEDYHKAFWIMTINFGLLWPLQIGIWIACIIKNRSHS